MSCDRVLNWILTGIDVAESLAIGLIDGMSDIVDDRSLVE